jgi:hypothetical protein
VSALASAHGLHHDVEEVRSRTRDVFADPIFDHDPSLVERVLDRFFSWLGELFGQAFGGLVGNDLLAWLLAGFALVVLGIAVWRWTRGLRVDASTPIDAADPQGRSPEEWSRAAEEAEAAGDLDLALRCRYLSLVAILDERGVIEPLPGRTIRELGDELTARTGDRYLDIRSVGTRVEEVVFGGQAATHDDLAAARRAEDSLAASQAGAG